MRFGNAFGGRLKLYFAEPREIGVAGLAGAAGGYCGALCPNAGEIGPPISEAASTAANSGRANSADPGLAGDTLGNVIVLLTLKISPPKEVNLWSLNSVKRSQKGICFKELAPGGPRLKRSEERRVGKECRSR